MIHSQEPTVTYSFGTPLFEKRIQIPLYEIDVLLEATRIRILFHVTHWKEFFRSLNEEMVVRELQEASLEQILCLNKFSTTGRIVRVFLPAFSSGGRYKK